MTAIKQVAVTSPRHTANLSRYLNDERALARDSQHISNQSNWAEEMHRTRAAYNHNEPSRPGAKNTFMFHQIIAWNPDECEMNGGPMTPDSCMKFAKEWIEERYPSQECIWVLHREHCKADGSERFAVHIAINRTDLETGKRLNEGRSKNAKIERANAMRDMDRKWGLRQMEAGKRNSRIHARQPTREERAMSARGIRSDKQYIRDAIRASMREAKTVPSENKVRVLSESLATKGVRMTVAKGGGDFTFERASSGLKVNGVKLGRGYSLAGITHGLGMAVSMRAYQDLERGI